MARDEARVKFVADTTEFNQQIKAANANMSELRSEAKLLDERFKQTGDAVGTLTEKKRVLSQELQETQNKIEALRQKLDKAREIYGENSNEVAKLKTQLNNAEREYASIENQIDDVNRELKENEGGAKEAKEALEKLSVSARTSSDGFTVFKGVLVELAKDGLRMVADGLKEVASYTLDVGMSFEAQMSKVQAISGATGDEMQALNDKAKRMGSTTKFTATEAGEAFEYMAMAGWKTGDMLDGIEGIMNLAAAAGENLGTTSDIVTDALTALGLSAEDAAHFADILAAAATNSNTNVSIMGETFKYVAPLAGALSYSAEDLAIATGLMANSGIKGSQAGTTLRTALTNLISPAETASGVMQELGFYTEETVTQFDQQKIDQQLIKVEKATLSADKAQQAYNDALEEYGADSEEAMNASMNLAIKKDELRVASEKLDALQKGEVTTIYGYNRAIQNEDGTMKSLRETLDFLRENFDGLSESEQASAASAIFGNRAMSGMLAVINASDEEYDKLTSAIDSCDGAAQSMADTMNDNLQGDLTLMQSALEGVGIQAYEGFRDPMRDAVQSVTETLQSYDVARLVNGIGVEVGGLAQKFAEELPGALNIVTGLLSGLIENFDTIKLAVETFIITWGALKALNIAMGIGAVIQNVVTLGSALLSGTVTLGGVTAALGGVQGALAGATGGISLLVTGVVTLVSWLGNIKSSTEKYSEAAAKNASVLTEFQWGMENLKPTLASTNDLLSSSGKTLSELDSAISDTENQITGILSAALGEQRQLREDELRSIEEYNNQLAELNAEKLETYRQQQRTVLTQIKAEGNEITQLGAAEMLVNAQAALDKANEISQASYEKRLADIDNFHAAQGTLDSDAYMTDIQNARAAHEQELAENQQYLADAYSMVLDNAGQWVGTDQQKWESILQNASGSEEAYSKILGEINMDNSKAFLQMYLEGKAKGAEISQQTEQLAMSMLNAFDDLPEGMDKAGKDTLLGLVSGMESTLPSLKDTTDKTANGIVDGIKKDLGIASPSRVLSGLGQNSVQGLIDGMAGMSGRLSATARGAADTVYSGVNSRTGEYRGIGGSIAEGIGAGMESRQGWLGQKVSSIASGLVSAFKNAFGIHSPSTVTAEMGEFLDAGLAKGIADNADAAMRPWRDIVDGVRGIDVPNEFGNLPEIASLRYDVSAQLGDYVASAIEADSRDFSRLISSIEALAARAIKVYIGDREIAAATAEAADAVNGARLAMQNRGVAL